MSLEPSEPSPCTCQQVLQGEASMQSMQALPAGGELRGRSLVAGDADIETGGGDIEIGKLMGTFVHVSTEDSEVSSDSCGAVKCGAIYADNLHLITGERGRQRSSVTPDT